MSESEAVELARASVEAFNRGDLEWLLERIDDDFEFDWSRSRGPLAGVYRGRSGLTEFLREQWETFETFHMEALEYIDCGRFVVVPNRVSAQGRNGIDVSGAGGGAGGDGEMTRPRTRRERGLSPLPLDYGARSAGQIRFVAGRDSN